MKNKSILFVAIIAILMIWVAVLTAQINEYKKGISNIGGEANEYSVTGISTDLSKVADSVVDEVCTVVSLEKVSSGFIFERNDEAFYVVTCAHSIIDENRATVTLNNSMTYDAELVGMDVYSDIAVLKVNESIELPETKLGNSEVLNNGEFLLCIGTPSSQEFKNSVNFGIVSSKLRTISNSIIIEKNTHTYYTSLIQLSSAVDLGYSGAPCFNMAGELVGVITMKSQTETMAMPINEIRIIARRIIDNEEINKTQLGIKGLFVKDLRVYEKTNLGIGLEVIDGLYVSQIDTTATGYSLGILEDDVIKKINDKDIVDYDDYLEVVYNFPKEYKIELVRNNEIITLVGTIND